MLLRAFSAEILGVLVAMGRDDAQAADAEPGLTPSPNVRCSTCSVGNGSLPTAPGSHSALPDVVQEAASSTAPHVRTTYKRELHAVRETLSPSAGIRRASSRVRRTFTMSVTVG